MKKILIIILLLFINNVSAKTYYSEYSSFTDWTYDYVEESPLVEVEKKEMSRYYKDEVRTKYFIEGMNTYEYEEIDRTKSYYTDFTEYSKDIPTNIKNRVIEKLDKYEYQLPNKVRYIKIDNISGGYGNLRFTEISISNIKYKYTCHLCNDTFDKYINNGITAENMSHIGNGGYITIDLNGLYDYDKLNILISIYDVSNGNKTFNIGLYSADNVLVLDKKISTNAVSTSLNNLITYTFNSSNLVKHNLYDNKIYTTNDISNLENINVINKETYYRYKDLYYMYYTNYQMYTDYIDYKDNDYPNLLDTKTFYRYRTKDYIEIEDNIVIKSADDLSKCYKSNKDVRIESLIDYSKNGYYEVSFITDFGIFKENVLVDIEDNKYNDLLKKYNALDKEFKEYIKLYEKLDKDYKNINNKYDSLVKEYDKLTKNNNKIIKEKDTLESDFNVLKKDYDNLKDKYRLTVNDSIESYNNMIGEINNYKVKTNLLNTKIGEYEIELNNVLDSKYKSIKELENEIFNLKRPESKTKINYIVPTIIIIVLLFLILVHKKYKKN